MSIVYRAEHLALGRTVALKLLAPQLSQNEGFRERFLRESRLAAALDHPNIIPIYEAGEREETFFIAMRYVDGWDLKSKLQREGPMDIAAAAAIVSPVASALTAAHAKGLIHRDVKPANILVATGGGADGDDHIYLSDFGIAKQSDSRALTRTGVFVGTAEYASPEQIEGKTLDGRADVYSLGCVLYECLTGAPAYDRDSEVALMYAHLLEPPPTVTDKRPDLPPAIDEIVGRAMAKQRDERYESARDLAAAVRGLASEVVRGSETAASAAPAAAAGGETVLSQRAAPGGAPQPPPPTEPPAPVAPAARDEPSSAGPSGGSGRKSRRPLILNVLIAVGAAVAAAIAVFLITRDDSNGSAAATSTGTTAATTTAPATTSASGDHKLEQLVPKPLWIGCKPETAPPGADEAAVCLPPPGSAAFSPDKWEIFTYANAAVLKQAYEAELKRDRPGKPRNVGRCDGAAWGGEGQWEHGPGKPGGHRFCFFDGNDAVIVWTHEKLGQATHKDMLAIAREGGSDHAGLFGWWRFWHHRVGKVA
jgi:serine/threonine-protein kinase